MVICTNCNKEFKSTHGFISYGFKKGEPFLECLCKDCHKIPKPNQIKKYSKYDLSCSKGSDDD